MQKLLVANWKMYLVPRAAEELAEKITAWANEAKTKTATEIVVCPSFITMAETGVALSTARQIVKLGAQNCASEARGALTGEISPADLREMGAEYVIIGHSERRRYLGETDELVSKKIKAALAAGLTPIMCVGETAEEKRQGQTEKVVDRQLRMGLNGVELLAEQKIVVAYEPVWAIGTGNACPAEEASRTQQMIKKELVEILERDDLAVLYGGSVDAKNIRDYWTQAAVDGVLVGGASAAWEKLSALLEKI